MLNIDAHLLRNPDLVCGDIDGELIALKVDSGSYLHLNPSASRVLALLAECESGMSLRQLCERLRGEYQVDEETCLRDLQQMAQRCIELDLIRLAQA